MEDTMRLFELSLFQEAPDDTPPDMAQGEASTTPDAPNDITEPDAPPDLPDDIGQDQPSMEDTNDGPPDLDADLGGDSFGGGDEDGGGDDAYGDEQPENSEQDVNHMPLDAKVSALMNMNLYQSFLTMLNTINTQMTSMKNASDMIYAISPDSIKMSDSLKRLAENIQIFLDKLFSNQSYSKNLFFYHKCLNLLKLLNDQFSKDVKAGLAKK